MVKSEAKSKGQKRYQESVAVIAKSRGVSRKTAQAIYRHGKAKTRSQKMKSHWAIAKGFQKDMLAGTRYRERADYSIGKSRKIATEIAKGAVPVRSDEKWIKQTVVEIYAKNKSTGEVSTRTVTIDDGGTGKLLDRKATKEAKELFEDAKKTEDSKEWLVEKAVIIGHRVNRQTLGGVE